MNQTLLQFSYFPSISWFYHFVNSEKCILDQHENFIKQSYRTRCKIYSSNGVLNLTIPIKHSRNEHQAMHEVKINKVEPWQKIHWLSLETAYRRTTYFEYYEEVFKSIVFNPSELLIDFHLNGLKKLNQLLKIDSSFELSSEFAPYGAMDLRLELHPKKESGLHFNEYFQPFSPKHGFIPDLSIIDLLCSKGPDSIRYIKKDCFKR